MRQEPKRQRFPKSAPPWIEAGSSLYLISGPSVVLVPLNVNTPGNVWTLLLYRDQQVHCLVVKTLRSNESVRSFRVIVQGDHGALTLCFVDFDLVCSSLSAQFRLGNDFMVNGQLGGIPEWNSTKSSLKPPRSPCNFWIHSAIPDARFKHGRLVFNTNIRCVASPQSWIVMMLCFAFFPEVPVTNWARQYPQNQPYSRWNK